MKVRCLRIRRGGHYGAPEAAPSERQGAIHVGGEYVVVGIDAIPIAGASYALLPDNDPELELLLWTSEMFEITSNTISPSWHVVGAYERGVRIRLHPAIWDKENLFERMEARDRMARRTYYESINRLYEEEGEPPPLVIPDHLRDSS